MLKRFFNKLMMLKAVSALMGKNKAAWETIPAIVSDVEELDQVIDEIERTQEQTSTEITGYSEDKDEERKKLMMLTFMISSTLLAMANRTGNEVLKRKVNFTASHLERQRDQQKVITARSVAELAQANLSELVSAGLSQEMITGLVEQTELYESLLPLNRISVAERKAANAQLKVLFKQSDKLLKNRLDRMMVRYETEDPAFYSAYENARMILDYGTRYEDGKKQKATSIPD